MSTKTVLIGVMDATIRSILKDLCEKLGVTALTTIDGSHALLIIRNTPITALIIDSKFPSVSGVQIARTLRAMSHSQKAHLLVIESAGDTSFSQKSIDAELSGVMVFKPGSAAELSSKLESILKENPPTVDKKSGYDVRILNCFIGAAQEVFDFYFHSGSKIGKPSIKQGGKASGYVSGLISLAAEKAQGSVSITCDRQFLELLAGKVFEGNAVNLDDGIISDLTGELCNQISGKVKINFGKLGMTFFIGLPKVVIGENHTIIHATKSPVISIPVEIMGRVCSMEFCLAEGVAEQIGSKEAEGPPPAVTMF